MREGRDRTGAVYESEIIPPDAGNADIRDMLTRWRRHALGTPSGDPPPRWMDRKALDPSTFKDRLGRINIVDVEAEPLAFRVRLDGTAVAAETAQDLTGKPVREAVPPAYGEGLHRDYARAVELAAPTVFRVRMAESPMELVYQRLVLPLAVGSDDPCTTPRALMSFCPADYERGRVFPWL